MTKFMGAVRIQAPTTSTQRRQSSLNLLAVTWLHIMPNKDLSGITIGGMLIARQA